MTIFSRANNAIYDNPSTAQENITQHGSDWLWAVFAVMLLTDLVVFAWQFSLPRGQRVFHQICLIILTTAAIAYFSMASNLGYSPVPVEYSHMGFAVGTTRQIWYVRYIDWVITTPCLLLELVLASGLPLSDIITLIFFDLVMIITGLVGSLVVSSYKWGYYTMGCAALIYIWWVLIVPARSSAGAIGPAYKRAFTSSAGILSFLWLLYPIAWGLADGGNVIHPDSEMVFYGVLDILAKPVFCFIHLFQLSKLDLTALQLSSGKFSSGAGAVNVYDREKNAAGAGSAATGFHGNGVGTTGPTSSKQRGFFGKKERIDAREQPATIHDNTTTVGN